MLEQFKRLLHSKYFYISLVAIIVIAVVLFILLPRNALGGAKGLSGNYVFDQALYQATSRYRLLPGDYREYYTFTKDTLIITDADGNREEYAVSYQKEPVSAEAFAEDFHPVEPGPDISGYQNCYLLTDDEGSYPYRVYAMDDELWLVNFQINYVTNTKGPTEKVPEIGSIYRIVPYDGELPVQP